MLTTISCSLAKCSCPSWNASIDESALRRALANLDDCSSSRHWWLEFWTFWVVFGVVMEVIFVVWEYVKERRDFRQGTIHTPERPNKVLFTLGLLGAGLVAAGVSGEFWEESRIATVETCIRKGNNTLFLLLSKEAGDAATSAQKAREELNAVEQESKEITERLAIASAKLSALEQNVLAQGPRWRLFEHRKDDFVKALRPFAGQRVTFVACGNDDPERFGLEQSMFNGFRDAKWDSPGHVRWSECPNQLSGGNEIYFVPVVDNPAEWEGLPNEQWAKVDCGRFNISHDASSTLCDVLYRMGIFTTAWREKPLPVGVGIAKARAFFGNGIPNSPAELAYKDPGRIFILIGPSAPMFSDKNKKPHKSAKPK